MTEWWSIEVFHGEIPASRWRDAYAEALAEAALSHGAKHWEWHEHRCGVVFEVEFESDTEWDRFRALPAVRAALDSAPDPVNGVLVYRGRGGSAGAASGRKPRPAAGAGAMALPEPVWEQAADLTVASAPGPAEQVVSTPG